MESFRAAAQNGATWVEFDVRPTGNGELVIHHDPITADGVDISAVSVADLPTSVPAFKDLATGLPELGLCLLYTSPSPRDATLSRMPSSA